MNPQILFLLNAIPESRQIIDLDATMIVSMVANLINFIVMAALLSWLLYKPVKKVLKARAERVEGDMKDAAMSKASAAELKAEYERKIKEIDAERAIILDDARKLATEKREQILDAAKAEAQDAKDRASRDIATEMQQIKGAVHQSIIDISADMAAKLIAATIDKSAHDRLFSEAMVELESTMAFRADSAA